jgi:prolyl 4-hydroxylase
VEAGGETALPLAKRIDEVRQEMVNPSECAAKGTMAVRPQKGDALLFFDLKLDGQTGDRAALHASCPTLAVRRQPPAPAPHPPPHPAGRLAPTRPECGRPGCGAACQRRARAAVHPWAPWSRPVWHMPPW